MFIVNMHRLRSWEFRRMWPLFPESYFPTTWSFTYAINIVLFLLGLMTPMSDPLYIQYLLSSAFTGLTLGVVCLLRSAMGLMIEQCYERGIGASLLWTIWFPVVYQILSLLTTLVALPKVILKCKHDKVR